jgi:hypothetical protein
MDLGRSNAVVGLFAGGVDRAWVIENPHFSGTSRA